MTLKKLDLIISGGDVFLPNSSIEKIDIGVRKLLKKNSC